jgi:osmoprotectant transport system ATP-binding protein
MEYRQRGGVILIKLENVTKVYPSTERRAVDELDLHVKKGEICVLVGASGCGKTTTMRMINRMIEATSGKIVVNDQDISTMDPIQLRLNIGYVIQEIGLFPHYTIEKNIATVPKAKKWDKSKISARVKEMLDLMELDYAEHARKRPSALSGGQRQRVGVARALAADPPIMLMDEPFGALDPITRAKLQNEFLNIQSRLRKTIVFVTHDMDEAVKMGDKIAVMDQGKLVQFGSPHEILTKPATELVEGLVGNNRILKRFALIKCTEALRGGSPVYNLSTQRQELEHQMSGKASLDAHNVIGVVDGDGRPVGYIPMLKYSSDDQAPIDDRIVPPKRTVSDEDTLLDALGMLFSTGQRGVFCIGGDGRALGLITMTDLFEAVRPDGD